MLFHFQERWDMPLTSTVSTEKIFSPNQSEQISQDCHVFFVSDGTGITVEALGHSLVTQFDQVKFIPKTIPYVNTLAKAKETVELINQYYDQTKKKPLIFASLVNPEIRSAIKECHGRVFDLFENFLIPMEEELGVESSHTMGKSHSITNSASYDLRIEAVNYTLSHDDGVQVQHYSEADLILAGVSRSGKTPTSLYMALQFGIKTANFPFVEEILEYMRLPEILRPFKNKIFGLTIDPERLSQIRSERRPNSQYATLEQCRIEIQEVENMFKRENIPFLNTTFCSIEEISTRIIVTSGIERKNL